MKYKSMFYLAFVLILTACINRPTYMDMIFPIESADCMSRDDDLDVTIMHIGPEIELYAFWFMTPFMDGLPVYVDEFMLTKNNFLQTFSSYTRIGEPSVRDISWVIFSANTDLHDFQLFTMHMACDPLTIYDYPNYFYYMASSIGLPSMNLPCGQAVIAPWSPSYIHAHTGVSFLDEAGQRRYVTLKTNVGDYGPPLILDEIAYFGNRADCPWCPN